MQSSFKIAIQAALAAGLLGGGTTAWAKEPEPKRANELMRRIRSLEAVVAELIAAQGDEKTGSDSTTPADAPQGRSVPGDFVGGWSNGIRFGAADGSVKIKIGGRIMADGNWFQEDRDVRLFGAGRQADGVEFRRARLYVAGTIHEHFIFKAQYDFATRVTAAGTTPGSTVTFNTPGFRDVYIGVQRLGRAEPYMQTIRIGHLFEPFGLETLTSSKYITFMERAGAGVFTPGRNMGVRFDGEIADLGKTLAIHYAAGLFKEVGDTGANATDGEYAWTARFFSTIRLGDEANRLVHIGVCWSLRSPPGHARRYRDARELHLKSRTATTGTNVARSERLLGGEFAIVYGAFSLQAEVFHSLQEQPSGSALDDLEFWGWYAYASVFVTGESRSYKAGGFGRVKPAHDFLADGGGWGALELAVRYSFVDLDDQAVRGGELGNVTIGVNWYLTPFLRVMVNYLYEEQHEAFVGGTGGGRIHGVGTRFQIDF